VGAPVGSRALGGGGGKAAPSSAPAAVGAGPGEAREEASGGRKGKPASETPNWARRLESMLEELQQGQVDLLERMKCVERAMLEVAEARPPQRHDSLDGNHSNSHRRSKSRAAQERWDGASRRARSDSRGAGRGGRSDLRENRHASPRARSVPKRDERPAPGRPRDREARDRSGRGGYEADRSERKGWHSSDGGRRRSPSRERGREVHAPPDRRREERREERSRSRSRSRSELRLNAKMPFNQNLDGPPLDEEVAQAEVHERPSNGQSGDTVWQAEICISQGSINHSGQRRTFTVRGPPRKNREVAEDDSRQLTEAASQGAKVVRALANDLHKNDLSKR